MEYCRRYYSANRQAYVVEMYPMAGGRFEVRVHLDTAPTRLVVENYTQANAMFNHYREESEREIDV